MKIKRLNGMFTVATQVEPEKVEKIASLGYKSLICNRPDDEAEDQPRFAEIARLAQAHGMQTLYLPVTLDGLSDADRDAFANAIQTMPMPMLAYCRSGSRSATLWNDYDMHQSGYAGREGRRSSVDPKVVLREISGGRDADHSALSEAERARRRRFKDRFSSAS